MLNPPVLRILRSYSRGIAFTITFKPSFTENYTVSTLIDYLGRIVKATLLPPR